MDKQMGLQMYFDMSKFKMSYLYKLVISRDTIHNAYLALNCLISS